MNWEKGKKDIDNTRKNKNLKQGKNLVGTSKNKKNPPVHGPAELPSQGVRLLASRRHMRNRKSSVSGFFRRNCRNFFLH